MHNSIAAVDANGCSARNTTRWNTVDVGSSCPPPAWLQYHETKHTFTCSLCDRKWFRAVYAIRTSFHT